MIINSISSIRCGEWRFRLKAWALKAIEESGSSGGGPGGGPSGGGIVSGDKRGADAPPTAEPPAKRPRVEAVAEAPAVGEEGERFAHGVAITPFWRFPDDVVVQFTPQGEDTLIELYSASRLGVGDLGVNPNRLGSLHDALLAVQTTS